MGEAVQLETPFKEALHKAFETMQMNPPSYYTTAMFFLLADIIYVLISDSRQVAEHRKGRYSIPVF
jgi:hypothetical protein